MHAIRVLLGEEMWGESPFIFNCFIALCCCSLFGSFFSCVLLPFLLLPPPFGHCHSKIYDVVVVVAVLFSVVLAVSGASVMHSRVSFSI